MQSKRLLKLAAVAAAGTLVLAACSSDSDSSTGSPGGAVFEGPVGDGEGEINILAWPGYAENGTTDPSVDWVTPFTEATGCKANVKVFGTSDEAVKLMQGGGWDVVSASGDASLRLIFGDSVQPVNTGLIPSYADIFQTSKISNGTPLMVRHSVSPMAVAQTSWLGTRKRFQNRWIHGR